MEHIGYILFDNWDSKNKQRYYSQKKEKLLNFRETLPEHFAQTGHSLEEYVRLLNSNYPDLEGTWKKIIKSIDLEKYTGKRNPIKHTHSGDHEMREQTSQSNCTMMSDQECELLLNGVLHDITTQECIDFLKKIDQFIKSVHSFIETYHLLFKIHSQLRQGNAGIQKRWKLWNTFLGNPFAQPLLSSYSQLQNKP